MAEGEGEIKRKGVGRVLKWDGDVPLPAIPNVNYAALTLQIYSQYGEDTALVDASTRQTYTYGDLCRMIPRVRNGLAAAGVRPRDSVILISSNHINMPVVELSLMLLGAACVLPSPSSTAEELENVIRVSGAKWAIASRRAAGKLEAAFRSLEPGSLRQIWILDDTPGVGRSSFGDLMKYSFTEPPKVKEEFDSAKTVALMPFSSGTTGLPKGVMLSHRNLLATISMRKFEAGLNPEAAKMKFNERTLMVLPMYHIYGFNVTINTLCSGSQAIILTRFSPKEYLETIQRYKVTFAPIVPYIINALLNTPIMKNYDLSSLRGFSSGSAPISDAIMRNMMDKSGSITIVGYALTESTGVGTVAIGVNSDKPDTVGKFSSFFLAKVIDVKTGEVLGEGQEGEVCIGGPSVMMGYANNPKATAETIDSEGWLHTGDIGYYDEDDFLYITSRIKDLIKVKGLQVAPAELEDIIQKVKDVSEVVVAGVPHERLGEAPRAWVVPAKGATIDTKALMKHVADHVAPYKQLAGGVEVVKTIPRNQVGKVLRRQLVKSYLSSHRSKL